MSNNETNRELTESELNEIVRLRRKGYSYREISQLMCISLYRATIIAKKWELSKELEALRDENASLKKQLEQIKMKTNPDKRLTTEFLNEYYQCIDEILNADRESAEFRDVIAKLRETIMKFAIRAIENDTQELYRRAENRYSQSLKIIDRELVEIYQLINSFKKTAETNAEIESRIINLCGFVMDVDEYYIKRKSQGYNDAKYLELRK